MISLRHAQCVDERLRKPVLHHFGGLYAKDNSVSRLHEAYFEVWQMRKLFKTALHRIGVDIIRYRPPILGRVQALGFDIVFDVGANVGQYAKALRTTGYVGRIISFEPVKAAFEALSAACGNDEDWIAINCALGCAPGTSPINIGAFTTMSSLLPVREDFSAKHDWALTSGTQECEVRRLDEVSVCYMKPQDRLLLKIDTQGSEEAVLAGATGVIDRIAAIQIEMSISPIYSNQKTLPFMVEKLEELGFQLVEIENGARNREGDLIEVDGLFVRR
jgi:FkbM family methyltransferase